MATPRLLIFQKVPQELEKFLRKFPNSPITSFSYQETTESINITIYLNTNLSETNKKEIAKIFVKNNTDKHTLNFSWIDNNHLEKEQLQTKRNFIRLLEGIKPSQFTPEATKFVVDALTAETKEDTLNKKLQDLPNIRLFGFLHKYIWGEFSHSDFKQLYEEHDLTHGRDLGQDLANEYEFIVNKNKIFNNTLQEYIGCMKKINSHFLLTGEKITIPLLLNYKRTIESSIEELTNYQEKLPKLQDEKKNLITRSVIYLRVDKYIKNFYLNNIKGQEKSFDINIVNSLQNYFEAKYEVDLTQTISATEKKIINFNSLLSTTKLLLEKNLKEIADQIKTLRAQNRAAAKAKKQANNVGINPNDSQSITETAPRCLSPQNRKFNFFPTLAAEIEKDKNKENKPSALMETKEMENKNFKLLYKAKDYCFTLTDKEVIQTRYPNIFILNCNLITPIDLSFENTIKDYGVKQTPFLVKTSKGKSGIKIYIFEKEFTFYAVKLVHNEKRLILLPLTLEPYTFIVPYKAFDNHTIFETYLYKNINVLKEAQQKMHIEEIQDKPKLCSKLSL